MADTTKSAALSNTLAHHASIGSAAGLSHTEIKRHGLQGSLSSLAVGDLMRIRRQYYNTESAIRNPEYLARTIAARVHPPSSKEGANPSGSGQSRKIITVEPATNTIVRPATAEASRAPKKPDTPGYMKSTGLSRSAWLKQCLGDMNVNVAPPTKAVDIRRAFLENPEKGLSAWSALCAKGASKLARRYHCRLDRRCAGDPAAGRNLRVRRPASAKGPSPKKGNKGKSLEEVRLAVQKADVASWKLRRFVEHGSGYLYQVWPRLNEQELHLEYNGRYVVQNSSLAEEYAENTKEHRQKVKQLDSLASRERASKAAKRKENKSEDGEEEPESDPEQSDDGMDDDFAATDDAQESAPFVSVLVTPQNTIELKVHLGESQLSKLNGERGGEEAISTSNYLFRSEFMCVGVDRQQKIDTWVGIGGAWKDVPLHVIRDKESVVDTIMIEGIVFCKTYTKRGGAENDPFQCTECGEVRRLNNFVYFQRDSGTIRRGHYYCPICRKKTVHLDTDRRLRKPQPTWQTSMASMPLDRMGLEDPPHKNLSVAAYM